MLVVVVCMVVGRFALLVRLSAGSARTAQRTGRHWHPLQHRWQKGQQQELTLEQPVGRLRSTHASLLDREPAQGAAAASTGLPSLSSMPLQTGPLPSSQRAAIGRGDLRRGRPPAQRPLAHNAHTCDGHSVAGSDNSSEGAAAEAEAGYRRCCESAWQPLSGGAAELSALGTGELCEAVPGAVAPSSLRCWHVPRGLGGSSRRPAGSSRAVGGGGSGGAPVVWFCLASRIALDLSSGWLRTFNYSTPTVSNKNTYPSGSLQLRGCSLTPAISALHFGSGTLARILPRALLALPHAPPARPFAARESASSGSVEAVRAADASVLPPAVAHALTQGQARAQGQVWTQGQPSVLTLLVVRISPKNLYHGHWDIANVFALLVALRADNSLRGSGGRASGRPRVRLVFVPPDKANRSPQPLWGPHLPLWQALADEPLTSALELSGRADAPADMQFWFESAAIALSGAHSVSGRGPVGRALDAACGGSACAAQRGPEAHLPPYYRGLVGRALAAFAQLRPALPPPLHGGRGVRALWLTRGAGLGGRLGYAQTVSRRCVNEADVLAAARSETEHAIEAADFGVLAFSEQLRALRAADVLTGMHGAGFANLLFLRPSSVVLELCAMRYCPDMYAGMAARAGLRHMRWRNTNPADDLPADDTRVPPAAFVRALNAAAELARCPAARARAAERRAEHT